MFRSYYIFSLLLSFSLGFVIPGSSQCIKLDEDSPQKKFPYLSIVYDRIFNLPGLDSFYAKLKKLKQTGKGTVSVVHIGDSHVKAGFYPGVVKTGLQDFFGNGTKDSAGVNYTIIGQNGARFETFNKSSTFWNKAIAVKADLYIISLGTNEAQGRTIDEKNFLKQVVFMIDSLKKISPDAAILITTVADSFLKGYPNRTMWTMNICLFTHCAGNNIPVWDLYRTTNGYGSAYNWIKCGMMSRDGVHYTAKAYQVQGQLLFNAIARGYNDFVKSY